MDAVAPVCQSISSAIAHAVVQFEQRHYLLAVSGGLDSMVMLDAMAEFARNTPGVRLTCAYVNHGLHPEAAVWGELVSRAAQDAGVTFIGLRCEAIEAGSQGLEAAARKARYSALSAAMQEGDVLVTAHHRNDQAETVLLQILRGAGVAGMSAMPTVAPLGNGLLLRPLLEQSREALAAYAQQRRLRWIEDPSNASHKHDRNFLRHSVMPALQTRWPAVVTTLGQLAATCADAQQVLDAAAQFDLASSTGTNAPLPCQLVRELAPARARNLLRFWLRTQGFMPPSRRRLEALLQEVAHAREDAEPHVQWEACEVRRYRDFLYAMAPLAPAPASPLRFSCNVPVTLPDGSTLTAAAQNGVGISAASMRDAQLVIGWRCGGERLVLPGRGHSTSLKKLLQQLGVLPWMRDRLPLVFVNGELAAVANLIVAAPFAVSPGAPGYAIVWNGMPEICAPTEAV